MTDLGRCDTGACLHVETDGDTTRLWETSRAWAVVETSTASWQHHLDRAKAEERAAIVAALRNYPWTAYWSIAERLEQGDFELGPIPPPENRPVEPIGDTAANQLPDAVPYDC
jgi:hypothetical protein